MKSTPSSTAIHEAGHCLAAWTSGEILGTVGIGRDPNHPGELGRCTYLRIDNARPDPCAVARQLRTTLAGPAAELLLVGDMQLGARAEVEIVRDSLIIADKAPVIGALRNAAREDGPPETFLGKAWQALGGNFLDRKAKAALLRLARKIELEGSVCGRDAAQVFESAFQDARPPEALPVNRHSAAGGKLEKKSKGAALTAALRALEGAEADLRAACADDAELERPLLAVMQARFKIHDEIVVEMERLEAQGKSGSFPPADFTTEP